MYKVMLVDDDYPVLELLADTIEWERLGMTLLGAHENGAAALEQASVQMPDILITDIGMPKMNGLELIEQLRGRKPSLRTAILSCHSEFHLAQQAMRLNVQHYLLKDTLEPSDMNKLLAEFKQSLDHEHQTSVQQLQLRHMVDRSRDALKAKFIRYTIHEPILDTRQWAEEGRSLGIAFDLPLQLPVLAQINDFSAGKRRFFSEDMLRFAVHNVMDEVIRDTGALAVPFAYGDKDIFLVFSFRESMKTNPFEEAAKLLRSIQEALRKSLKLSMSMLIGDLCGSPELLKQELTLLLSETAQQFYMEPRSIAKLHRQSPTDAADLFARYDEACGQFRDMLLEQDANALPGLIKQWSRFLHEQRFAPETVKEWVLKLVLDIKLKFQSLQYFRGGATAEVLHREIVDLGSLAELEHWLTEHFHTAMESVGGIRRQSHRTEVIDACQYVSLHLGKRISLEEVSERLHLNPSYFSRLFKKETGETFIEYVTRTKIERAKELLDQTSHSVGKIGEMLGYDNQSYFIKTFKTQIGLTPIEYRGK
ncbi:response regulator transcription factor [Paenibacillus sp. y28]|uniref:response regulator transcription factor n=1 Tax=Paenibacillus sp. y28 TaxID=3129110 RepID=UPI0030163B93